MRRQHSLDCAACATPRRQDRRTLNARNRRLMDAKLIIFIVMSGLMLVGIGSGLLVVYIFYQEEFKHIRPVIVIGPVLIGGGVVTILCSGHNMTIVSLKQDLQYFILQWKCVSGFTGLRREFKIQTWTVLTILMRSSIGWNQPLFLMVGDCLKMMMRCLSLRGRKL